MTAMNRRQMIKTTAILSTSPLLKGYCAIGQTESKLCPPVVAETVKEKFHSLPFETQVLGGLFAARMATNVDGRLRQIDQQAFLSGFVHPKGDGDYIGESAGKFLDTACNALRYRWDAQLRGIMEHIACTMLDSQAPDGYLGTYPTANRWEYWDVWVHKENLTGLLSYYELTGNAAALTACRKIGDLLDRTFGEGPGKRDIAAGLHLGMASTSALESMCRLYRFTGERRYLEFCQYVVRAYEQSHGPKIISALLDHGSVYRTANGKAYEMLVNLVGIVDLYRITADEKLLTAVLRAWDDIVEHQLYFTGALSAYEHFQPPGQMLTLQASDVGEMCVTVTWLQLNWRLLRLTAEARFGHAIERSVYNQLLAAQNANTGDISYYTSFCGRKEHTHALLCCVSSGPRGISLLPQFVWGLENRAFVIHLYSSGHARFEIAGVVVEVSSETEFPAQGSVILQIKPARPVRFTLKLRVPEWASTFEAKTNSGTYHGTPGQILEIEQRWTSTSLVEIHMELPTRVLSGEPDYPGFVALQRGPQILALEKQVNSTGSFLSRLALSTASGIPKLVSIEGSSIWNAGPLYETDGVAAAQAANGTEEPCRLRFVPFADALDYCVWITDSVHLRGHIPPLTQGARARVSEVEARLEPTDKQIVPWTDAGEYITDERPETFCIVDPSRPGARAQIEGNIVPGNREDPVWFAIFLDQPITLSQVVYRHGRITQDGGWFDTAKGKPRIEVVRKAPPMIELGSFIAFMDLAKIEWEIIAELDTYLATDEFTAPRIPDRQPFEIHLPQATTVYALRIVGHAGGKHASCAELSAYA